MLISRCDKLCLVCFSSWLIPASIFQTTLSSSSSTVVCHVLGGICNYISFCPLLYLLAGMGLRHLYFWFCISSNDPLGGNPICIVWHGTRGKSLFCGSFLSNEEGYDIADFVPLEWVFLDVSPFGSCPLPRKHSRQVSLWFPSLPCPVAHYVVTLLSYIFVLFFPAGL